VCRQLGLIVIAMIVIVMVAVIMVAVIMVAVIMIAMVVVVVVSRRVVSNSRRGRLLLATNGDKHSKSQQRDPVRSFHHFS